MSLFVTLLVAISLSMDAFSLSLVYGTIGLSRKEIYFLSGIVGIFHYFMPVLGFLFGKMLAFINTNIIVSFIFSLIGIEMIISSFKEEKDILGFGYLLFALVVSIDSFSVGITLDNIVSPLYFSIFSFIFTFVGLKIGDRVKKIFGKVASAFGGIILLAIALLYLLN